MHSERKDAPLSFSGVGLTDEDIYEAMKKIPGYIDITPGDFKEIYGPEGPRSFGFSVSH